MMGTEIFEILKIFQNIQRGDPQYVGTWFPWFQGHPLISGAMPLESGAGFA